MGRILALDYGLKNTGLAWTDPLQIIATALYNIETSKLLAEIAKIVQTEPIESILVGYPKRLNGEDSHITSTVENFAETLKLTYPNIPVNLWDERYTSKMALNTIIASGMNKKHRSDKKLINTVSAVILLQSYLESKS